MTLRHDSELMTEARALTCAKDWSCMFGTYETVEKMNIQNFYPPLPPELCFYVTNRFDPNCNIKTPGYHPEL